MERPVSRSRCAAVALPSVARALYGARFRGRGWCIGSIINNVGETGHGGRRKRERGKGR